MMQVMPWANFCLDFLMAVVFVVVGATVVRSTHATSGYMLAGAGVLELLTACCGRGEQYVYRAMGDSAGIIFSILGLIERIAFFGLVIGAAVMLANAVLATRAEGAPEP